MSNFVTIRNALNRIRRSRQRPPLLANLHFWLLLNTVLAPGAQAFNQNKPGSYERILATRKVQFGEEFYRNPQDPTLRKDYDLPINDFPHPANNNNSSRNCTLQFPEALSVARETPLYPTSSSLEVTPLPEPSWTFGFDPTFGIAQYLLDGLAEHAPDLHSWFTGSLDPLASQVARHYREANDKSMYLNHTTIVAHLVNGIYLQSGLMDGKIPVEELVGELLNFGTVKVSDVASFKSDKVTAFIAKLKEVNGALNKDASNDIKDAEAEAVKWDQLRVDYESLGDFGKLDGSNEFFAEVTKAKSFQWLELEDAYSALRDAHNHLSTIKKKASNDLTKTQNVKSLQSDLDLMSDFAKAITDGKATFEAAAQKFNQFNLLKNGRRATFKSIETMIHLAKSRGLPPTVTKNNLALIKNNLNTILGSTDASKAAGHEIKNVNDLVKRRVSLEAKDGKFADGFAHGISDLKHLVKDVRDPWIGKMVGVEGSKLNGLADGLQPLIKSGDQMSRLDEKLKPISKSTVYKSLLDFNVLQSTISQLVTDAPSSTDVIPEYERCGGTPAKLGYFTETETFLASVKELGDLFKAVNIAQNTDVSELKKDIDGFVNTIKALPDTKARARHLNSTEDFQNIINRVEGAKLTYIEVNAARMKNHNLPAIELGKTTLKDQQFVSALNTEKALQTCLSKLSAQSQKLSQAVKIVQRLRDLDSTQFDDVTLAASTVSAVSKELSAVKSIPETMKKEAKEATTAINKFSDAAKHSKTIGQSVSSLQYAYGLMSLDATVTKLKTLGATVEAEIQKISNPNDRKTVEDQWGNHKDHVKQLEDALVKIKDFEQKLDVSKATSMAQYGYPLQNLATLSDANINAKAKLEALDTLISTATDPTIKASLEEARKALEPISSLDLQFSSHKSQFQSAPPAFKTFHDFLAEFLSIEHNTDAEGSGIPWGTIGMCALIALPFILIAIVAFICLRQRIGVSRFCSKNRMIDEKQAWIVHAKSLHYLKYWKGGVECLKKSHGFLAPKKHRYPTGVCCNPDTAVVVGGKKLIIHANMVVTARGKRFIATQGPLRYKKDRHDDTVVDFYSMVFDTDATAIVSCVTDEEIAKGKCSAYYPTVIGKKQVEDRFEITLVAESKILDEKIMVRTLSIHDTKGDYKDRTVFHYQFIEWPDHGVPHDGDPRTAIELLSQKPIADSKGPVIVHCSAGIGRTMSFIGLQYVFDAVVKKPRQEYSKILLDMRDIRWHAVQTTQQVMWILVGVIYLLAKKYRLGMKQFEADLEIVKSVVKKKPDVSADEDPEKWAVPAYDAYLGREEPIETPAKDPKQPKAADAPTEESRATGGHEHSESSSEESSDSEDDHDGPRRDHVAIEIGED